jgi:hypothetical protein
MLCFRRGRPLEDKKMIGKRFPLLLLRLRGQLTNGKDHTGDYDGLILLWHYRDISKLSADVSWHYSIGIRDAKKAPRVLEYTVTLFLTF